MSACVFVRAKVCVHDCVRLQLSARVSGQKNKKNLHIMVSLLRSISLAPAPASNIDRKSRKRKTPKEKVLDRQYTRPSDRNFQAS